MNKLVSVVIPCLNEEKYIVSCLLSLINSDYPEELLEIIVVDGGSSDKTLKLISDLQLSRKSIRVLNNPKIITPVSLNIGIENAKGDFIMIASAHSGFPSNYISLLMQKMDELNCDCIGGSIDTRVLNSNPVSESIRKVMSSPFGVGNSSFRTEKKETLSVDTVPFGIYKKSIFNKVGNYNEKLIRNHDIEFSKRIIEKNIKIWLVSSLRSIYYARDNYRQFSQNNFRNGFWNVLTLYITRRFRSLSLRHFIPLLFVLSIIIPPLFAILFSIYFIIPALLSMFLYLAFVLYLSFKMKDSETKALYIAWGFFVLHFSYGFGSLSGLIHVDKLLSNNSPE